MSVYKIKIKPLSVNKAWKGRRFKTKMYKDYEKELTLLLPKIVMTYNKMMINIEFGFTSPKSDIDNPLKPLLDILQKKYKLNDRDFYELRVTKKVVNKPYISFSITYLE